VNFEGNYLLNVDNIVDVLEKNDDKFSFEKFFYSFVNGTDNHDLEMTTYMKIN